MKFSMMGFMIWSALGFSVFAEGPPPPSFGNSASESVIAKFRNDLTFYAAFDETADASMSNGKSDGKAEKPAYGPGKLGKALSGGSVSFPAPGNVDSLAGTVIIWLEISRTNLPAKEEMFFPLTITFYDEARKISSVFIIGKMDLVNNALMYSFFQQGSGAPGSTIKVVHPFISSKSWKKGDWHLLTLAWQPGVIRLSVDGQPFVKNSTMPPIVGQATRIAVNATAASATRAAVSVDELMVFNRAVSDEEIDGIWNAMNKYAPLK